MSLSREESRKLTEIHTIVTKQLDPWVKDHEQRLRKVETTQTKGLAVFATLTVLVNGVISFFGGHHG